MKILMLAPQPFFEERGTPIAVDLLLRGLSERGEQVDLLTLHIGKDVAYSNVKISRIRKIPFIKRLTPGFSFSKIVCGLFMLIQAFNMAGRERYTYVHAVEESVFIALLLKMIYKIPYVYDMDSSLAQQLMDLSRLFLPFRRLLFWLENLAIRNSTAVVPVCEAIYPKKDIERSKKVVFLKDVSLLNSNGSGKIENIRENLGIRGLIGMYVGNLEKYQGIDLLIESFHIVSQKNTEGHLVIIGGNAGDINHYKELASYYGVQDRVHFLGPRPVNELEAYLSQADFLVSPRIKGKNTPMKIYSYLDSGKPLLATDIPSHSQVLTEREVLLAQPDPESYSSGLLLLLQEEDLRKRLGWAGKKFVMENHTIQVYQKELNGLYDWLAVEAGKKSSNEGTISGGGGSEKLTGS
jgi:glycosyltransferase involved in cell wall biosynthesis